MRRTLASVVRFGEVARVYQDLRSIHPGATALAVKRFIDEAEGETFSEFQCLITTGHEWVCSGTSYDGDDASYHGDGRCYCSNCGADSDA